MPTAAEIAAAVRDRPAGEVIADICRDLGIVPSHPLWDKIWMVVTEFGGNVMRLYCAWETDPTLCSQTMGGRNGGRKSPRPARPEPPVYREV